MQQVINSINIARNELRSTIISYIRASERLVSRGERESSIQQLERALELVEDDKDPLYRDILARIEEYREK